MNPHRRCPHRRPSRSHPRKASRTLRQDARPIRRSRTQTQPRPFLKEHEQEGSGCCHELAPSASPSTSVLKSRYSLCQRRDSRIPPCLKTHGALCNRSVAGVFSISVGRTYLGLGLVVDDAKVDIVADLGTVVAHPSVAGRPPGSSASIVAWLHRRAIFSERHERVHLHEKLVTSNSPLLAYRLEVHLMSSACPCEPSHDRFSRSFHFFIFASRRSYQTAGLVLRENSQEDRPPQLLIEKRFASAPSRL